MSKQNKNRSVETTGAEQEVAVENVVAKVTPVAAVATDSLTVVDDGLTETSIVAAPETTTALAVEESFHYGDEYADEGVKLKADEVIIPIYKIVQTQSEVYKKDPTNVKLGDIYDTITGKMYSGSEGLLCLPILSETVIIVRDLTSAGGKFIAKTSADLDPKTGDPEVIEAYKENGKDGWRRLEGKSKKHGKKVQFVYTEEVYVALVDPSDQVTALNVVMIPFSGKNLFVRKQWWSALGSVFQNGKTSPSYSFRTLLKTVFSPAKEAGRVDTYKFCATPLKEDNWAASRIPSASKKTVDNCLTFKKLIQSGALGKVDYSRVEDSESSEENAAFVVDGKAAF